MRHDVGAVHVKRIFITGSGGILGRHVRSHLTRLAPTAEVIRNSADLTDLAALKQELQRAGDIDLVLHLAALVPVAEVRDNPAQAFAVNAGGTMNLLAALGKSAARFVYCSSSHVYAASDAPLSETADTTPVTVYGQSKLMGEQGAQQICKETGRSLCIARVFSIHDPEQAGSYLRPTLERRFAQADPAEPFELYGAGGLRDFLPAEEAAQLLVQLALSDATGVVNVASGAAQTVAEFAQSLAPFALNIAPKGENNNLVADVTRLTCLLGEQNV